MSNKLITVNSIEANVIGQSVAIGTSEFNEIIRGDALYADKSLFIKDIIDNRDKAILITRPRRWGKTLNLSMLQNFFAPEVSGQNTAGLFDNLLISTVDGGKYMEHQGQYAVIFITFKDVKKNSLEDVVFNVGLLVNKLYREHSYLLTSTTILDGDKAKYTRYRESSLNQSEIEESLLFLSELLHQHYKRPNEHKQYVYILIDEYDTPLNETYNTKDFQEIVTFMKNFLSNALKGNAFLKKGIMTGTLRISKVSILSGLNNLETYTMLEDEFSDRFGFMDSELDLLFKNQGLEKNEAAVKSWYDGYIMSGLHIYNPWSIMHCLKNKGELRAYWVHTASDLLLRKALQNANSTNKQKLQKLILGEEVEGVIVESVRFDSMEIAQDTLWSMLLYTGYLTSASYKIDNDDNYICKLLIPNKEIKGLYKNILINWLGDDILHNGRLTVSLMNNLITGEIKKFSQDINDLLLAVASFHDYAHDPEAFYHGFMLALSASLLDNYYIHSNKESGKGRPDLLFIPKAHKKNSPTTGVILEFKHVEKGEIAKDVAIKALEQINSKNYAAMISQHKYVTNILCVGLAFDGKRVECAHKESKV